MDNTEHKEDTGNRFSDEELQNMLGTVRHVPNKQDNDMRDLYGLSGKSERESSKKKDRTLIVMIIAGIVILVIILGFIISLLVGRALEHDPLKGTWTLDDVTVYTFNGKGHGKLNLPLNAYEFDYVLEGNRIEIDFSDPDAIDRSYSYSVTDDELVFTGDDDTVYVFVRTDSVPRTADEATVLTENNAY